MAQPTVGVVTVRHLTAVFKDGTGSPLTKTLGPGPGDLTWSGVEEANKVGTPIYDRGGFLELAYGQDNVIEGSITVYVVGDDAAEAIIDALCKTGDWASATTTDAGGVVLAGTIVATSVRDGVTNIYTFSKCRWTASYKADIGGNTYSLSFKCYGGLVRS